MLPHSSCTLEGDYQVLSGSVGVRSPKGGRWDTSRIPDITILPAAQIKAMADREAVIDYNEPPPILVAEVVSPSTKTADYRAKRLEYNYLAIPEYWIVDPLSSKVTICSLEDELYSLLECREEDSISSLIFPSLSLTADQVLAGGV